MPDPAHQAPQPVIRSSLSAVETPWSAFVAAAEADLSPTVPIMLTAPRTLPAVSHPDRSRTVPHYDGDDGTVVDGTARHDAAVDGTDLAGSSVGGTARYDPEPGAPALRPDPAPSRGGGRTRPAVRRLLMTPWFAASTGFVIAAGMSLYSPHASITFPSAIGTIHCRWQGCVTPGGKSSGSLASSAPGQRLRTRHEGGGSGRSGGANEGTARLRFTFMVLWHGHDWFGAKISISGSRSLGDWQLAFRLPGTQIQDVFGAEWLQSASGDGGTASPFHVDSGGAADHVPVSFRIFGTGSLSRPTSCTFDGATCTFKVISAANDGAGGSDGGRSRGGN